MENEQQKKTILMVEDDSFLRHLYRDKFEKEGFNFIESSNGVEGMHRIESEKPNMVILDILLPIKSGFDILEEMNESGLINEVPVIIFSNLKQDIDIEEARRLGAKDYFIKSETNFSDLAERVKYFIR